MLKRLVAEARMHQSVADADGLELITGDPGDARYLTYLLKRFGFESPLESALSVAPGISDVIDLHARNKTGLLARDLGAMGVPLARILEIPHAHISAFHDLRTALGWLYVSERTAAIHNIVVRELVRRAPRLKASTQCFADDDGLAAREELGRALDAVAVTRRDEHAIVDAALQAFDHQHRWLNPQRPTATTLAVAAPRQRIAHG
jgi:heme oxygenase